MLYFAFCSQVFTLYLNSDTANWGFACSDSSIQPPASQNHSAFAGQSFGPGGIQRLDKPSSTASIYFDARMLSCF